jgi:CPA1 family monovalent cation:H+ antiporter
MNLTFEKGALLLLISAVVAMLTRRIRLPYSVGLVAAGIVLAFLPYSPSIELTKELLFSVLLPPLIFEAAFELNWTKLRAELPVVVALATLGVGLSAGATAAGMHYLVGWPWLSALVFGTLIAATDPVSVIATFKEAGAHGRLRLLVESESLLNDGTAAVFFAICLELAAGIAPTPLGTTWRLLFTIGGSLLCGAAVAGGVLMIGGKANDHLLEITFTTVAAYGSFVLAEHFHFSGVLATMVSGLVLGNVGSWCSLTERGREAVKAFWEYAAFAANSLVFLLIGIRETHENFRSEGSPVLIGIALVTAARAITVYPCCALFSRSALRVTLRHQHVLFWGGLRGALALALALGLPESFPQRGPIVTVSFAVVAFSVFVQGLTLTPLLRRFQEIPAAS